MTVSGARSMNRHLVAAAAAAVALAGGVILVVPQHAVSILRLFAGSVVVAAGALVLSAVAPYVAATPAETALDRTARRRVDTLDPHGLRDARRDLGRGAAPDGIPTEVWQRLRQLAELRVARAGLDPDVALAVEPDAPDPARSRPRLSAVTSALLASPPAASPTGRAADPTRVAAVVHRVLDDLDTLAPTPGGPHGHR